VVNIIFNSVFSEVFKHYYFIKKHKGKTMQMKALTLAVAMGLTTHAAMADIDNISVSGFGSIIGSKVLSSTGNENVSTELDNCPCYINDYNTGAYITEDDGFNFEKETRVGLQLGVQMNEQLSFTTQIVARTLTKDLSLEWAFASYAVNDEWTIDVGRKRIPMYYFSTFQDVGLAYTWVRPPQALYGWQATNYNGASVRYSSSWGDWDISSSVYGGTETLDDAPYNDIYYEAPVDAKWDKILGLDFEVTYEWFNARFVYMQSEDSSRETGESSFSEPEEKEVMGIAINGDFEKWFFHLEASENSSDGIDAPASMAAVGLRLGAWTPFISWSEFDEEYDEPGGEERFTITSLTLRYDINPSNAVKVQVESFEDRSEPFFVGDTTVLSASYDFVF
jgi:hypothetical protein